jgi:phycocyanobilin:ferredoxin oxidoreductase
MLVEADLIDRLDQAARNLAANVAAHAGAEPLATPDWLARAREAGALRRPLEWRNQVVATPALRRLHVEFLALPGELAVLHVCGFPQLDAALPIFGFDVICGRERATGCFLDLSPSVPEAAPVLAAWEASLAPHRASLGEPRILPEWTRIFSPSIVAVRPRTNAEFRAGLAFGAASLRDLLAWAPVAPADPRSMGAAQRDYVLGQRRNDRTRRMLAGCIGAALTDAFIDECLFPLPEDVAVTPLSA